MKLLTLLLFLPLICAVEPIILGSGNWQFEFKPNAIQLPKEQVQLLTLDLEACDAQFKGDIAIFNKGYNRIDDANFTVDDKFIIVAVWQRKRNIAPTLFALKKLGSQTK